MAEPMSPAEVEALAEVAGALWDEAAKLPTESVVRSQLLRAHGNLSLRVRLEQVDGQLRTIGEAL